MTAGQTQPGTGHLLFLRDPWSLAASADRQGRVIRSDRVEPSVANIPTVLGGGRYRVLRALARGGMAELYLARLQSDGGFDRLVVVKRLAPTLRGDTHAVELFTREARMAARLEHDNTVRLLDVCDSGGELFLVMEHLHGRDLHRLLKTSAARVPQELAIYVTARACHGLHHAHGSRDERGVLTGMVHRDVSPTNIMLTFDGGVKVIDFGIARAIHTASRTRSGMLTGKVPYMSPEQCLGEDLDARSDIFSLGIVLYEMLAGVRPFRAESEFAIMNAIVSSRWTPLEQVRADVPLSIATLVTSMLARQRDDRPTSALEIAERLEAIAVSEGFTMSSAIVASHLERVFGPTPRPVLADFEQPQSVETALGLDTIPASDTGPLRSPQRSGIRAAVVTGIAALALGGGWLALETGAAPTPESRPPVTATAPAPAEHGETPAEPESATPSSVEPGASAELEPEVPAELDPATPSKRRRKKKAKKKTKQAKASKGPGFQIYPPSHADR